MQWVQGFFPGSKVLRLTRSRAIPLLPVNACKAWTGTTLLLPLCLPLPLPYANGHKRKLIQQHFPRSIPVTERKSEWYVVYNKHVERWETSYQ
jgi:hypothetical protein